MWICFIEKIPHIVSEVKIPCRMTVVAALRPNHIQNRTGLVFPPDNKVGVEIKNVEIRIVKLIVRSPIGILIHRPGLGRFIIL